MRWLPALLFTGCTLQVAPASPDAGGPASPPSDLAPTVASTDLGAAADLTQPPPVVLPANDLAPIPDLAVARPPRTSPILVENQLAGDSGWRLTAPSNDVAGFAGRQSYAPGDSV